MHNWVLSRRQWLMYPRLMVNCSISRRRFHYDPELLDSLWCYQLLRVFYRVLIELKFLDKLIWHLQHAHYKLCHPLDRHYVLSLLTNLLSPNIYYWSLWTHSEHCVLCIQWWNCRQLHSMPVSILPRYGQFCRSLLSDFIRKLLFF